MKKRSWILWVLILKLFQNTLEREIKLVGTGAYTRQSSGLWLRPADTGSGIIFSHDGEAVKAGIENAEYSGPEMKTTILKNSYTIICPEHLLAALFLAGVTNAEIELEGREEDEIHDDGMDDSVDDSGRIREFEIPMFNGSAYLFYEAILSANIVPSLDEDYRPKRVEKAYRIKEPFEVKHDGRSITAMPLDGYSPKDFFRLYTEIDYDNPAIGRQAAELNISDLDNNTLDNLLSSRTFCFEEDLIELEKREPGIIDMAKRHLIVIDSEGNTPKKMEKLRYNEAVLHKTVDLLGDLSLLGYPIIGELRAIKPGHGINQDFAMALYREAHKENGKAELIYID
ncbi:hypothetical protein GF345_04345 [Candidatus Woesearchaeota archaeon]|nr:hypothetical protein [Candidatus Woesearchaeota archaeon]